MDEQGSFIVEDPTRPVTVKDRYRVEGAGVLTAEAVTYGAENVATQQHVALAVLRGEAAADPEFVAAVRDQAGRLAKVGSLHRALVRVYEAGTTDAGEPFVAREAVDGPSLRQVIEERGALDVHHGLRLAIQVGEGLEALHQSGIVHGELRPESVVLVKDQNGDEAVKLGVELTAAHRTPAGRRARDRALVPYLAPEQVAYGDTSEAADVHALGLLIREMLTGQRPDGRSGRGGLPPAIARVVAKALEPAPGRRYSSISLMVNDLWSAESDIVKSPRAAAPEPLLAARKAASERRRPSDVGMAAALVLGLMLVGVTAWVARSDRLARTETPERAETAAASPRPTAPAPAAVAPSVAPPAPSAEPPATELPPAPAVSLRSEAWAAPPVPAPAREARKPPVENTKPALVKPAPSAAAPPAPAPAAVRASRPVAATPAAPASEQRAGDSADGTAIIDWLLKGGRSAD